MGYVETTMNLHLLGHFWPLLLNRWSDWLEISTQRSRWPGARNGTLPGTVRSVKSSGARCLRTVLLSPDLYSSSARLKSGELMTLMGRLEPESAPISKNVRTIQIRADLTKLWRIFGSFSDGRESSESPQRAIRGSSEQIWRLWYLIAREHGLVGVGKGVRSVHPY